MAERKEPGLNPDSLESLSAEPQQAAAPNPGSVPSEPSASGRGSGLLTLILLLLAAGGGYLGYTLIEQQTRIEELSRSLEESRSRLASLEESLAVTSDSAEQSGQTLQQRLQEMNQRAREKYAHFDSEIAKLWTVSYQRNKPQLEQQAEALKALEQQQSELGAALSGLQKKTDQIAGLQAGIEGLEAELGSQAKRVEARVGGLERQLDTLERSLKLESEGRLKVQQELAEQLAEIEGDSSLSEELAQRIRQNEQAIKAIDGTRRQLSQDLLRIRQQLNNLQLHMQQSR